MAILHQIMSKYQRNHNPRLDNRSHHLELWSNNRDLHILFHKSILNLTVPDARIVERKLQLKLPFK
jgi:hypothetical protein